MMTRTKKTTKHKKKKINKITEKDEEEMAFLESIFNAITDGVTVIDRNCNIIFINQSLTHFYGYKSLKDIIGKKCYETFEQRKRKCKPCPVNKVFDTKKPQHTLHTRKDSHGNETYWELYFYPILDDKGKVVRVVEYSRNITREKKLEDEIKESERRLSEVMSITRDMIAEVDTNMKCTFITDNVKEFLGYTPEEILKAKNFLDFLTPESKTIAGRYFKARMAGKTIPKSYELDIVHKNGKIIPAEIDVSYRKKGNKILGIVATVRDITERKKVEEALRESKEKYRMLLEQSADTITYFNADGLLLAMNHNAAEGLGGTPDDFIGKSLKEMFDLDLAKTSLKRIRRVTKSLGSEEHEDEVKLPTGKRWFRSYYHPMKDGSGNVIGVQIISHDITERKEAEDALMESEKRFRNLFEKSPISITLADKEGTIIDCNKSTEKLVGYTKKEIVGKPLENLLTLNPEDLPKLKDKYEKFSKGQKIKPYKLEIIRKDGKKRWLNVITSLIEKEDEVVGYQVISRDITERELAEEALRESEELYRTFVETSPDAIAFTDLDANIIMISPKGLEDLGYDSPEELIGKSAFDLMALEDRPRITKNFQEIIETGQARNVEFNFLRKDGTKVPVEFNASLILDEKGEPKAFLGISRDITVRRKVEEARRESEEKYSYLFHESNDAIILHDLNGDIVDFNQRVSDLFGFSKKEVMKLKIPELHPSYESEKSKKAFKKISKQGHVNFEIDFKKKNGEVFPAEVSSSLFEIGGKKVIQGIVRDITERKKAEEALRELKDFNESIVESMNEGVMILDEDGYVSFINPKIEKMLGYKRTKLVGEHWSDVIAPDYHRRMRDCYAENLRGEHDRFEAVLIKKNRTELPVLISAAPQIKDEAFNGVLAVITDISERKKEEIEREELMRYKMKRGSTYLIEEKELNKGKDVVYELYKNHFDGVIITREHPEKIKRDIDLKIPLYWMTNDPRDKMSVKPEFPLLEKIIDDNIDRNTFVFLDRFDYLVTQNSFKEALNFIQHLNETFYARKAILIISLDPETLNAQELSLLEKETLILEKRHEERLSADLLDLLEFVNNRNRVGESPSYKQVGDEFRISRTTARKRIGELINKGLLIEKKSGRFKFLILTDKGKDYL